MRIAILADPIDNQYAGVHVYTRNLVEALLKHPGHHEYFLIRARSHPHIEGVETIVVPHIPGVRCAPIVCPHSPNDHTPPDRLRH
jgi:hypothetical protein